MIRLIANLSIEESYAFDQLHYLKDKFSLFFDQVIAAVERRSIETSEEFILNAISCITNLLFYDVPQRQILTQN